MFWKKKGVSRTQIVFCREKFSGKKKEGRHTRENSSGKCYASQVRGSPQVRSSFQEREKSSGSCQVPHVRGCPEIRWKPSGKREIVRKD